MPNLQQRAELLRIAEAMHTGTPASGSSGPAGLPLPSNIRSSSQERELLPSSSVLSMSESACSLCGADTQSPDFRPSDHGENLCGRGTISCPLCAKTFSLWSHYEAHKKCHQKLKQRQYPCQTCGKIFTSASNRNMHQRIHKGVRPFQCTPCGVFFRQKAHLQKHQKTQGHIQATEIYEKKKREGGGSDQDSAKGSSPRDNHSSSLMIGNLMRPDSVRSVDSNGSASTLSLLADSTSPTSSSNLVANESFSPGLKAKSSPKRKQAKPSQLLVRKTTTSLMRTPRSCWKERRLLKRWKRIVE
jgi:DNA-directed RNA polymerase subunit RPC12/RpoP